MKKSKYQDHPEWCMIYDLISYRCKCGGYFTGMIRVCNWCMNEFTQQKIVDYEKSLIKVHIA